MTRRDVDEHLGCQFACRIVEELDRPVLGSMRCRARRGKPVVRESVLSLVLLGSSNLQVPNLDRFGRQRGTDVDGQRMSRAKEAPVLVDGGAANSATNSAARRVREESRARV
jgi:hypothetical protein